MCARIDPFRLPDTLREVTLVMSAEAPQIDPTHFPLVTRHLSSIYHLEKFSASELVDLNRFLMDGFNKNHQERIVFLSDYLYGAYQSPKNPHRKLIRGYIEIAELSELRKVRSDQSRRATEVVLRSFADKFLGSFLKLRKIDLGSMVLSDYSDDVLWALFLTEHRINTELNRRRNIERQKIFVESATGAIRHYQQCRKICPPEAIEQFYLFGNTGFLGNLLNQYVRKGFLTPRQLEAGENNLRHYAGNSKKLLAILRLSQSLWG